MRNRNWLVAGLVVSLAVNLLLVGFVAGHRLARAGVAPAMMDPSLALFRVVRRLPEPRREAFQPVMREHFRAMGGKLDRMRRAQKDVNDALTAEPFDAEALQAALEHFRAALLELQRNNGNLLVKVANTMSADERRQLEQAMVRRHHAPGHRDDGPRQ